MDLHAQRLCPSCATGRLAITIAEELQRYHVAAMDSGSNALVLNAAFQQGLQAALAGR